LSDSGYASARTRSAVLSAAKALGYVPNAIARGLKTQKSGFIAFIMPEVIDPYFFATVARGVEEIANGNGFQILLGNNDDNQLKERNYIEPRAFCIWLYAYPAFLTYAAHSSGGY
jgi:LacI family transcriptional regulator